MDSAARTQIILAAVAAAGGVGDDMAEWTGRVEEMAATITTMVSPASRLSHTIDAVENSKVFRGAIVQIRRERSSTRGVLTLFTGTDRANKDAISGDALPAGCEQVRTARTDDPSGLRMARRAQDLIGHDVLVWVEIEEYNNGNGKLRVLRHVEDLGPSTAPMAVEAAQTRRRHDGAPA